jgi:hypothetical protein
MIPKKGRKNLWRQLETIARPYIEDCKQSTASLSNDNGELETVGDVTLFQSPNYKLCVSLGEVSAVMAPVRAVFDTGAGPNIVRDELLPSVWEILVIPSQPLPRITKVSGN